MKKNEVKILPKHSALANLNKKINLCQKCSLSQTRQNALCGEGNLDSRMILIALSPGKTEDAENRMFIGPSGKVINRLLDAAGIDRESVYMTNLVKCHLPKNRRPKLHEIESCSCYVDAEISIIQAEVIVPLGFYAARYILTKYEAELPTARKDYARLFGTLIFSKNQKILPLPHPSALLHNPALEPETIKKYQKLEAF